MARRPYEDDYSGGGGYDEEDDNRGGRFQREREVDAFGRDVERRYKGRENFDDDRSYGGNKRARRDDFYAAPATKSAAELLKGDTLLSFKDFILLQDSTIDHEKAPAAYAEYKTEFDLRNVVKSFGELKNYDWFKEKYLQSRKVRHDATAKQLAKEEYETFMTQVGAGEFEGLTYDKREGEAIANAAAETEGTSGNIAKLLYIKTVPPSVEIAKIEEMCKKVDGFVHLELEDVNPQKKYHRSGYAYYKADVDANAACKAITHTKIDNFEFFLSVHTTTNLTRSNTVDPGFSTLERKVHDHKQAIELVTLLDKEKSISPSFVTRIPKNINSTEVSSQLDLLIAYLRNVHYFDYYTATETQNKLALLRKTGSKPERPVANNEGSADALLSLDQLIKKRLEAAISDDQFLKMKPKNPALEVEQGLQECVVKVEESKYRCSICSKLFKGPDFVVKHLSTKHTEKVSALEEEAEMYNNYLRDANRFVIPSATASSAAATGGVQQLLQQEQPDVPLAGLPAEGGSYYGGGSSGYGDRSGQGGGYDGGPRWSSNRRDPYSRRSYDHDDDRRPRVSRPPPSGVAAVEGSGRPIRSYHDLDAPPSEEVFDYRNIEI